MKGLSFILELENVSVAELSSKIDVAASLIYRWIKGTKSIPEKRISQLSEMFPAYGTEYYEKELDEIDKLTLENKKKENQIRNLSGNDPLELIQQRKRLQNEIYKNETLIDQQKLIENMAVLFSYTYNVNVNSFSDVSAQRIIISHFSDLMEIEGKILFEYFENENNTEAFKEASKEIMTSIKKFSDSIADSLTFFERLIEYSKTNRNE